MPVTWDALHEIAGADAFDIDAAIARLSAPCPYMTALAQPQTLTARTLDALSSLM